MLAVLWQLFLDLVFVTLAGAGVVLCTRRLIAIDKQYEDGPAPALPVVAVRATTAVVAYPPPPVDVDHDPTPTRPSVAPSPGLATA